MLIQSYDVEDQIPRSLFRFVEGETSLPQDLSLVIAALVAQKETVQNGGHARAGSTLGDDNEPDNDIEPDGDKAVETLAKQALTSNLETLPVKVKVQASGLEVPRMLLASPSRSAGGS